MFTDNLILDFNKIIKIPQNIDDFFIINKSNLMKCSIEIKIKPFVEIDTVNLYLIIKSYSNNLKYVPLNLFTIVKNPIKGDFVASNFFISEIKKLSYYGFTKWIQYQFNSDWKYVQDDGEYFLVFSYYSGMFDVNLLNDIKPDYPWKEEIMSQSLLFKTEKELYEEIEKYKKKINELEREVFELKKKN